QDAARGHAVLDGDKSFGADQQAGIRRFGADPVADDDTDSAVRARVLAARFHARLKNEVTFDTPPDDVRGTAGRERVLLRDSVISRAARRYGNAKVRMRFELPERCGKRNKDHPILNSVSPPGRCEQLRRWPS